VAHEPYWTNGRNIRGGIVGGGKDSLVVLKSEDGKDDPGNNSKERDGGKGGWCGRRFLLGEMAMEKRRTSSKRINTRKRKGREKGPREKNNRNGERGEYARGRQF